MDYTSLTLSIALCLTSGLFGIFVHNLIKLDKINRKAQGELNLGQYLKLERFAIMLSISVVVVAIIAQQEIKALEIVGKALILSYFAIGYAAQSIVVSYMGRAENFLNANKDKTDL